MVLWPWPLLHIAAGCKDFIQLNPSEIDIIATSEKDKDASGKGNPAQICLRNPLIRDNSFG